MKEQNQMIKKEEREGGTPADLIAQAIKSGVSIEHLERLMSLQERWQANKAKTEFLESFAKFQSQCPPLEKTKKVSFGTTKYSYAPLGEIVGAIKTSMKKCGLSFRWELNDTNGSIACTCIVSHLAGHSEKTTMSANKDASGSKNEIQQRGSAITYLQRYTLIASLGIGTADEDIDGHAANEKQIAKTVDIEAVLNGANAKALPSVPNNAPTEAKTTPGAKSPRDMLMRKYFKELERKVNVMFKGRQTKEDIENYRKPQIKDVVGKESLTECNSEEIQKLIDDLQEKKKK